LPDIPVPVNDKSNTEALAGTAPANAPTPAITPANNKFFIGNPLIDKIARHQAILSRLYLKERGRTIKSFVVFTNILRLLVGADG
jgi:hypothetical protein